MDFDDAFRALTDNGPFPWQRALYKRFMSGNLPKSCNLPTGLGKTSVIAIWLLALANQGRNVPRRLVYVVNRRTVVDQATNEAETLRKRIFGEAGSEEDREVLGQIAAELRAMTAFRDDKKYPPLAISTLRGQFADNREWSADPSRPAIILGTVDMIGSRLLFSGYGIGFKSKPLHAGFLGQDVLLVHDEAHLEPAFQKLIEAIQAEQKQEPAPLGERMRLKVMALTATFARGGMTMRIRVMLRMGAKSFASAKRIEKILKSRSVSTRQKRFTSTRTSPRNCLDRLSRFGCPAQRGLQPRHSRLRSLGRGRGKSGREIAQGLAEGFDAYGHHARLCRDDLVNDPIFERFLPASNRDDEPTVYLVCTSAGEVGVNISADHLVCDLSTYESMAQRFGRVNRFGKCDDTRIDIVYAKGVRGERRRLEGSPEANPRIDAPLERQWLSRRSRRT